MQKVISHSLDKGLAKRVIDKAVAEYSKAGAQYKPQFAWENDTKAKLLLTVLGSVITADIKLNAEDVTLDVTVPPKFKMFENKAMDLIDGEVQRWLKKAKSGKL